MSLDEAQQKSQDKIFHKHGGPFWCPGNFWVRALIASEVEAIVREFTNDERNAIDLSREYEALWQFRKFLLSLDGYWFRWNFFTIQSHKERFLSMEVEELLEEFSKSDRNKWESDREYYFALFQTIEEKLEEKWIDLWFDNLFEFGI